MAFIFCGFASQGHNKFKCAVQYFLTWYFEIFANNVLSSPDMKKFIAVIFLTIFTMQLLPIKAIGKLLCSNQMTEEVHEESPLQKKMNTPDHDKFWYLDYPGTTSITESAPCYIHALRDEALIKCMHLDVLLQPPNFK